MSSSGHTGVAPDLSKWIPLKLTPAWAIKFIPALKVLFLSKSMPKSEVFPTGILGFVSCNATFLAKKPIPLEVK